MHNRQHLLYGLPHASREDGDRAAQLSNAHDFITAMVDDYDTQAGEKGDWVVNTAFVAYSTCILTTHGSIYVTGKPRNNIDKTKTNNRY